MERTSLFIGRFQPFHIGHENAISQIAQNPDVGKIIIGIGSSQYHHYFGNPFTFEEREDFIRKSLELNIPFEILAIPDLHDFPKWVPHVESLCPKFQVIYCGNTIIKPLFEQRGYSVETLERTLDISATQVRDLMVAGRNWQSLVPNGVREILEEINGVERIKILHNKYSRAANTADLIIEDEEGRIALIERLHEPFAGMLAIAGGYLNVGLETTAQAALREAREETGLDISPEEIHYLGVYDEPQRDPRGPTISHVYYTKVSDASFRAGDDAKSVQLLEKSEIPAVLAFDHRQILDDYLRRQNGS